MQGGRANVSGEPLPPGAMGLPLVGETMAFIRDPFHFLTERQRRHGNIFKSRVVGRRFVFLAGTEGAEAFYDDGNITRLRADTFNLVDMFGGINMAMFDGPRHVALKSIALTAFDHAAMAGYVAPMEALIASTLDRLAQRDEFSALSEMRTLAMAALCRTVIGLPEGPETESIGRDYALVLTGVTSTPVPLPGLAYGRARGARDRLLARIRRIVTERRARPGEDALSRILAARAPDGSVISDAEAVLEIHHILVGGYNVYGLMVEIFHQLAAQPELRDRCRAEVEARGGGGPLSLEMLRDLKLCTNVVLEAKRLVPLVPVVLGRAKRDFTCMGFRIPKGWTVALGLHLNNRDSTIYTDPDRFDPDRFTPPRAEQRKHPLAYIPQGTGPPTGHLCLGVDYSTLLALACMALLLRGYGWDVPPQRLEYNWRKLPPEPFDGMRVRLRARPAAATTAGTPSRSEVGTA
jgi:retinoid hydroxylase